MIWRKWLPILVGMVMLFSCENDDDGNTSGVFRFYVPDGFMEATERYWIILSDEAGTVLDWKPLENANTYSYTLPANVNGVVTVTTVSSKAVPGATGISPTYTIATYTNVPVATYKFDLPVFTGGGETSKPGYLELSGLGESMSWLDWIYPQGVLTDTTYSDTWLTLELAPLAQKTGLLAIVRDEPKRYFYSEITSGKTIKRTAADFTTFTPQAIGAPEGTVLTYLQLAGNNAYGEFPYYADAVGGQLEVPTVPDVFDSYTLQATLHDPTNHLAYTMRLTGALPDEFPILESSVEYFTAQDDILGWKTTTTSLDAVNITYSRVESGYSLYWTVVGDGGEQSVALPRIPDEIPLTGVPAGANTRSFTALAKDGGVNFSMLNFPHYSDYQDYLRKHYLYRIDQSPEDYLESAQYIFPE